MLTLSLGDYFAPTELVVEMANGAINIRLPSGAKESALN
jgi:hypothetical protein